MASTFRRSPLALAVLGLLEAGPLHPYGIQQLVRQWGKDQVINVGQRATLYKMITRLRDAGLIEVQGTGRDEQYPERTIYQVTPEGRAVGREWLAEILSTPRNEFPEFPAALSFLPMLTPDEAAELLEQRRERLVQRLAELDAGIAVATDAGLPRVTVVEGEYVRAVTVAELRWVGEYLDDLRDGSARWTRDELAAWADAPQP
ncbi:PadR family transcriptional regulator [Pseudonocardia xinjiangensis]|jgi:DNA-binding PadR family transcriptional regulator|uniref:PadR family transcriptional regulator n=1 Tax=Pseudonocardia xinjiangensis TaxID=75289 RepID=UPI003D8B0013